MYFHSDPAVSEADLHVLSGAMAFGGVPWALVPVRSGGAAAAAATATAGAAATRVPTAPPGSKTARYGRTNKPQNRTEKLPNVPSETLLKLMMRDMRELMKDILDGCCRCCCCCCQKSTKSTSRRQNSKARKDEQATESHRKTAQRPF